MTGSQTGLEELTMQRQFVNANAVIIAQGINPSVFTQAWLVENEIVRPAELTGSLVVTPQVVSVDADRFAFLAVPDRLQFVPKATEVEEQADLMGRLDRVVQLLPHNPYSGLGLNFVCLLSPDTEPFDRFLRRSFWMTDNPLFRQFDEDDARCGVYLSKDTLGFRLKLDVKPIRMEQLEQRPERLHMAFNFHRDVPSGPEAAMSISEGLESWVAARGLAESLAAAVTEED
jgi:hypothetical protein